MLFESEAFKVLLVFPFPSRSHSILGEGYVRHLLNAGHEVTYISPYPMDNSNPNLRQISVADNLNAFNAERLSVQTLINKVISVEEELHFHNIVMNVTRSTLENPAVLKLVNDFSEQFDVVVSEWMFNEVFSGFAAVFNCPYIWSLPFEPNFVALSLIDEATNPAYTANIQLNDVPPFTFIQRASSLSFQIMTTIKNRLFYYNNEESCYQNNFEPIVAKRGRTLPSYYELGHNASFMLGYSHVSLGQAIRLPQNYKPIAGFNIDGEVEPLSEDLKVVVDNAKNGVIFFSLGSNMKSKDLSDEVKQILLKVFSELKQVVVWKFEEELPNKPQNVHIFKWAPQQSILAHPNCVLFITHGGLLSITEAVHFGVPFIGIPFYFDQHFNVGNSVSRGIAKKVTFTENVAENIKEAIQDILNNPKYHQRMKEISFTYHNRPISPGKELVFWVEHTVYSGGAPLYRSPAIHMPWFQKMYLDLFALLVAIICSIIYLIRLICVSKHKIQIKKKTS
ncbi:unnamed protein product [Parnassius apollo]|uniref:(apollo) hypothetical protein n=1 Tax=Parnassius apollo TaxID=110799 RepID=A0A8S3Y8C2_PARAO|nr:unnamed protein product [Parnassius apollo]